MTLEIALLLLFGLMQGSLPPHLSAWSPLLELGDQTGAETLPTAIVKVASLTKLAEAVTYKLEIDPETQALFDDVGAKLETLDPGSMYAIMERSPLDASRRAMSVYGELSNKWNYRVISARTARPARFGDLALTMSLKPAGRSYLLETDVAAHLEVTASEIVGVVEGSMDWIRSTANLHGARAGAGLDEADRQIGRGLASAFPAMSALAMKYFEPLDGVAASPGGSVRGRLVGRLRRDAFAKDYPELAELLTGDVKAKLRARVTTPDGRTLAVIKIDSGRGEGAVVFEVDPDRWLSEQYRIQVDLDAELFGMHLEIADLQVRTAFTKDDRSIALRSVFDRTPTLAIGGAALGIIPIAVVDMVIPSNVQSIVESFLSTLAKSDAGKGASLTVILPEARSEPMQLITRAALLDNGFVSFCLQIASSEVLANDAILVELQRLQERCLSAFSADFARFQEQAI